MLGSLKNAPGKYGTEGWFMLTFRSNFSEFGWCRQNLDKFMTTAKYE